MPLMPSFITGGVPTAAHLNTIGTGIDVLSRIAIGKPASAAPSARPAVKVVRLNTLALTTATTTMVPWESAVLNTDGMWSPPAGSQVTITTAGWYRIAAGVSYDPGNGGLRICRIFVNGTADPANVVADSDVVMGAVNNSVRVQAQAFEHFAAGTTVQLGVFQNSGANVVLDPQAKWGTWMTLRWAAPY